MLRAQFSYKIYQSTYVFHWRFRENTVPKIKDMSRPASGLAQDHVCSLAQFLLPGKQHYGIKVALHRAVKSQAAPRLVEQFRAPGVGTLAVATVQLSGCREVDFTLGGKPQPTLGAASGPQFLKIAGLPWTIPSL